MKVNTNSWHFRAVDFAFDSIPKSLCTYFWAVVAGCELQVVLWTVGVAILVGAIYFTVIPFVMLFGLLPYTATWVELSMVASFSCYLTIGLILFNSYWKETLKPKLHNRPKRAKRESLVGAYVRAKKQRICPTLEFVD